MIGASKPFDQGVSRAGPGVLYPTPHKTMLAWADVDPEARAGFLVAAYPLLQEDEGQWRWRPEFEVVAQRYGASRTFRGALRARIFPSSWGGSLNSHLLAFKEALETWSNDQILGVWASNLIDDIDSWLAAH